MAPEDQLDELLEELGEVPSTLVSTSGPMGLDRFPFDRSSLTPYHHRLIARIAKRVVASWHAATPIRVIRLIGHTDSRGPAAYNYGLGLRRARTVQAALTRAVERIRPGLAGKIRFLMHSLGAARPVAPGHTAASRARNRRVTVSLNVAPAGMVRQAEFVEHERSWEAPPAPSIPVPSLLYSESTVPTATHYVKIVLGQESPASPMTGIFFPERYRIPSQVDLLLYLQGHHTGGAFPADLSIDVYWLTAHYPFWAFREGVNISKKNVILVAPTLGPHSEAGKLISRGGLAWYLDQVLASLRSYGPFQSMSNPPPLGDLIVACHSGGGSPMRQIALTPQPHLDKVRQYWGFDCLYDDNDPIQWANWAKGNPNKELFIHYGNGGTAARSRRLQGTATGLGLRNVTVDGSESLPHNRVPITHWHNRLRAARFLLDRSGRSAG
jgi:hypothetical protein